MSYKMIKSRLKLLKINREHAQSMVEFALVFPIILLITYGIIEFGRMVFIYAAVTGAAREGARYGAAAGTPRHYMDCAGIKNAVQKGAILTTISNDNIYVWFDHGPNMGDPITPKMTNPCVAPVDSDGADLIRMGDRVVVYVIGHYSPVIGSFLGIHDFTIKAENARTILVDVVIVGTALPPMATNTVTRTPTATAGASPTPSKTPTVTLTRTVTRTPTVTQTYDPSQTPPTSTPTLTSTPPACKVSGGSFEFHSDYFRWTLTSLSTGLVRLDSAFISWPTTIINPANAQLPDSGELNVRSNSPNPNGIILIANSPNSTDLPHPLKATNTPTRTPTPTATLTPTVTPTITPTPIPYSYLVQINVGVNNIWIGLQPPPSASVSSWIGDESRRELNPGRSHILSFLYSPYIPSGEYTVTLTYLDVQTGLPCYVSNTDYYTAP
jgi:TadE-like protein